MRKNQKVSERPPKRAASATNITPTQSDGGGSGVEWKPPPENERPKHPGYEAPIEATEETKTQYQIYQFRDATDFV
ncbi:unnamed protein product [Caenorhabditis bovis]|uniref:Uncharacterized protein n=1 Tax=Caenorhabditis bovis TaxID=2654633 RepID=A0A8S1F7N0_9PELO|nr:unnamed protein product [Caenorhabditis bovis]